MAGGDKFYKLTPPQYQMVSDSLQALYSHLGEPNAENVRVAIQWLGEIPSTFDTDTREERMTFMRFRPRSLDYKEPTQRPHLARSAVVGSCARQIDKPHGTKDIDLLAIMVICAHLIQLQPREGATIDLRLFVSGNFDGRSYRGVEGWQGAQTRAGLPYLILKEYSEK